jgi:hypothetical protein
MKEGAIGEGPMTPGGDVSTNGGGATRPRGLLFVQADRKHAGFVGLAQAMLDRGHDVVVVLDQGGGGLRPEDARALGGLRARDGFDEVRLPRPRGVWRMFASAVRRSLDYLAALESQQGKADEVDASTRKRAPRLLRALLFLPPFRWRFGRRPVAWVLRRVEAALPIPRAPKAVIREQKPDVVLLFPPGKSGFSQGDLVRAARATGTPSVLVMGDRDLSSADAIRDVPTLTVVSDQDQVNEAVRVCGLSRERVQAVGAAGPNGNGLPAAAATVDAADGAARAERVPRPSGAILRAILLALTPLLFLTLLLLHPVVTSREGVGAVRRLGNRIRARRRRAKKARAHKRKTARAAGKGPPSEAATQRKAQRAQEKQQQRERREERREQRRATRRKAGTASANAESGDTETEA